MANKNPLSLLAKLRRYDSSKSVEEYLTTEMRQNFKAIENAFSKAPSYQIMDIVISSGAETQIPHTLGSIPNGYVILGSSDFSNVKFGDSAWTATDIFLIASTTATFRIGITRF